eukprot:120504_1
MSTLAGVEIALIIVLILHYTVIIPLVYFTYQFYQTKANQIIQFRDPPYVVCFNSLIVLDFSVNVTRHTLHQLDLLNYPIWVTGITSGIFIWGFFDLLVIKSYLLFFTFQYHKSIENFIWKKEINEQWSDFYIRNKNTWGNFSYLIRWVLIPYILTIIIQTVGGVYFLEYMFIFYAIVLFTPILLLIIFAYYMGKFIDIYGIRKEIIGQILTLLFGAILYFIIARIVRANVDSETYAKAPINTIIVGIIFGTISISSVYYPLRLIRNQYLKVISNHANPSQNIIINTSCFSELLDTIKDSDLLSLFMQHLIKEFATESLLFIVEIIQIKYYYQLSQNNVIKVSTKDTFLTIDFNSHCADNINHIQTYIFDEDFANGNMVKIEIPMDVPKSNILTLHSDSIKNQFKALYEKYFKDFSHYQINLSYEQKQKVENVINNQLTEIIEGDLYWLMDECVLHILRLLMAPFFRFKETEQFEQFIKSKTHQTKIKKLEMINMPSKPEICNGDLYEQIKQKYSSVSHSKRE